MDWSGKGRNPSLKRFNNETFAGVHLPVPKNHLPEDIKFKRKFYLCNFSWENTKLCCRGSAWGRNTDDGFWVEHIQISLPNWPDWITWVTAFPTLFCKTNCWTLIKSELIKQHIFLMFILNSEIKTKLENFKDLLWLWTLEELHAVTEYI